MSAEIIPFPKDGNGAREAIERIMDVLADDIIGELPVIDTILLMLAEAGYVIVPIKDGPK